MGKFIGRRAKVDPVVPTDETKGGSVEDYEALLSQYAAEDYEDYEDDCGGAGPPKGFTDGSSTSATEEESNLLKAVKSVPAQAVYPVVPTDETKGGSEEGRLVQFRISTLRWQTRNRTRPGCCSSRGSRDPGE
jgi:hypothetical protein